MRNRHVLPREHFFAKSEFHSVVRVHIPSNSHLYGVKQISERKTKDSYTQVSIATLERKHFLSHSLEKQ
jgi:hypothetical protein